MNDTCTEPGCRTEFISSAHRTAHLRAAHPDQYADAVCPIHPYCLGDCAASCLLPPTTQSRSVTMRSLIPAANYWYLAGSVCFFVGTAINQWRIK